MSNQKEICKKENNEIICRGKINRIVSRYGSAGGQYQDISILKGRTAEQHCHDVIKNTKDKKGYFKQEGVTTDSCYITYQSYFDPKPYLAPVWEYGYNAYKKIKLTSETVATLPANRNRTTIGVGEAVKITSNIDVQWESMSNLVDAIEIRSNKELIITAGDKAGSFTVKAKTEHDEQSMTFTIVEPKDVEYFNERVIHKKGNVSIGFLANMRLLPNDVNFDAVQISELEASGKGTGIWSDGTGQKHCSHGGDIKIGSPCRWNFVRHNGQNNLIHFSVDKSIADDKVFAKEGSSGCPLGNGSLEVDIPIQWKIGNSKPKTFVTKNQILTTNKNGISTASKGNTSISRSCNDPDSNIHEF